MREISYYDLLGVPKNASALEIKKAYNLKSWQFHPDLNHNTPLANKKMALLNKAYLTLSNQYQRKLYDIRTSETQNNGYPSSTIKSRQGSMFLTILLLILVFFTALFFFHQIPIVINLKRDSTFSSLNFHQRGNSGYKECLNQALAESNDDQDIFNIMKENCLEQSLASYFYK